MDIVLHNQLSDVEGVPASDVWFSVARQRLASYHSLMNSSDIARSSERFAELSQAMRGEARVLEQLSKLFMVQWRADTPGINFLPREILDYIFSLVAQIDRPSSPYNCHAHTMSEVKYCQPGIHGRRLDNTAENNYPDLGKGGCLGWLRLGHVCQSWRSALLALPMLWASDIGLLPRGFQSMLERAQHMPLTIRVHITACRPEAEIILSEMVGGLTSNLATRARKLEIIDFRVSCIEDLDTIFDQCTFPLLEYATIFGRLDDPELRPLRSLPTIRAPFLRSLHFIKTFYPWSSSTLASLSIGDVTDHSTDAPWMEIKDEHIDYILRSSAASLETLSMSGCCSEIFSTFQRNRIITTPLPKLRSLRIHATLDMSYDWAAYSRILASTSLPATASLLITTGPGQTKTNLDATISVIKDCVLARKACNLDGLVITDEALLRDPHRKVDYFTFSFYPDTAGQITPFYGVQDDALLSRSPLVISHEFPILRNIERPTHYLQALIGASVLTQIATIAYMARTSLFFNEQYTVTFPALLRASNNVRTLSIRIVESDVFEGQEVEGWKYLTDVLKGPVLPQLEYLTLHGVVNLPGLSDVLHSRTRSLGETGQRASKLRELRLNVAAENGSGASSEREESDAALISTLHEFADSVVLSRV